MKVAIIGGGISGCFFAMRVKELHPDFDVESIDVIVEIIDPKHHDIVSSYILMNYIIYP